MNSTCSAHGISSTSVSASSVCTGRVSGRANPSSISVTAAAFTTGWLWPSTMVPKHRIQST